MLRMSNKGHVGWQGDPVTIVREKAGEAVDTVHVATQLWSLGRKGRIGDLDSRLPLV